jgi:hypothetical protein
MLNFQGFQAKLDTEEDFLSCVQKEKDTLPNFYQRFLQLKAQAPEVSDDQVIAQAIKTLRVGPLHNHLVRERPKTVPELYEQLAKFSKSEIQHFCKLEQQRKISKPNEAPKSSLQWKPAQLPQTSAQHWFRHLRVTGELGAEFWDTFAASTSEDLW